MLDMSLILDFHCCTGFSMLYRRSYAMLFEQYLMHCLDVVQFSKGIMQSLYPMQSNLPTPRSRPCLCSYPIISYNTLSRILNLHFKSLKITRQARLLRTRRGLDFISPKSSLTIDLVPARQPRPPTRSLSPWDLSHA